MSQDHSDYEKKLAQAQAARQRQRERQQAKLACPEHQQKRLAKQQAAQSRALERNQQRLRDPQYQEQQRQKQLQAAERQRLRAQQKTADPDYIKQQLEKKAQQLQIQQERARQRSNTEQTATAKTRKTSPARGLKGRNPTAREKQLGNKIAAIGCICCLNQGWYTSSMQQQEGQKYVSLHHVDGRTKSWAHAMVLPLCAYHHDTPAPVDAPKELMPLHRSNKKEWVHFNGTEEVLLKQVYEMIEEEQPWLEVTK